MDKPFGPRKYGFFSLGEGGFEGGGLSRFDLQFGKLSDHWGKI